MKSLFSRVFGQKSRKSDRKPVSRKLRFESVERRDLLAGGGLGGTLRPAPMPFITVNNNFVPEVKGGVLPSAKVEFLDVTLKCGRDRARVTGFDFLPAVDSDAELWRNLESVSVYADMNSRVKGCETLLVTAYADANNVISADVTKAVWLSSKGLHVEVYGKLRPSLEGEYVGLDIGLVSAKNLRDVDVPFGNVYYAGVDSTLQMMQTQTWQASQHSDDKFGCAEVGQQGVSLLKFSSWKTELVAPKTVAFVAAQGNLADATYSLWADTDWDDIFDVCVCSAGTVVNGKLVFDISNAPIGMQYEVRGAIATNPVSDHLQLAFPKDGSGWTAVNTETGKALLGISVNGNCPASGAQTHLYTGSSPLITFVENTELAVKELSPEVQYANVEPGAQDLVLDAFTVHSEIDMVITHVAIAATYGNFNWCDITSSYVSIWWDTDGDNVVDTSAKGVVSENMITFDSLSCEISAGETARFEVRANARDDISYGYVKATLAGDFGIAAKRPSGEFLAIDQIFKDYRDQTAWNIGGGLG